MEQCVATGDAEVNMLEFSYGLKVVGFLDLDNPVMADTSIDHQIFTMNQMSFTLGQWS